MARGAALVPAGRGKVETQGTDYFTRVLLTNLNYPGNMQPELRKSL
jgi:hypothetical protein